LLLISIAPAIAPHRVPEVVRQIDPILLPSAASGLRHFYRAGGASSFRVYLDDTCMQPNDWRAEWQGPLNHPTTTANERWWWVRRAARSGRGDARSATQLRVGRRPSMARRASCRT
jgi:hypothetical protein